MSNNAAELYALKRSLLLEDWRKTELHRGEVFNEDGIVNPEIWFSDSSLAGRKILFILKEAYHADGYAEEHGLQYSLVDDLKVNAIQSVMWKRVAEWAHGLMNTTPTYFPTQGTLSTDDCKDALNKIAVINLKKSAGKPTSDDEDIAKYVAEDRHRLMIQIESIDPDIIICGNTYKWFCEIVGSEKLPALGKWVYRWNNTVVVDYYHPANQFPTLLNYYGLMAIYQKSLSIEKIANNPPKTANSQPGAGENNLEKLMQAYYDSGDYEKAEELAEKILSQNVNVVRPWIIKAYLAEKKAQRESVLGAINYYQKALEIPGGVLSGEVNDIFYHLESIRSTYINLLCAEMLGGRPKFVLKFNKKYFDTKLAELKNAFSAICEISEISYMELVAPLPFLIFSAAQSMRDKLIRHADEDLGGSVCFLASGTNYLDFQASLDILIKIAVDAIEQEANLEERLNRYNEVVKWDNNRVYLASRVPTKDDHHRYKLGIALFSGNEKEKVMGVKETHLLRIAELSREIELSKLPLCPNCGERISQGFRFCTKCGTEIKQ